MPKTLSLTPPIPLDPEVDWLHTDPDRGSKIWASDHWGWVDLSVPIENDALRSKIAFRFVDYYERLYSRILQEDGFGSEDLIENLDFIKDTITAWRLWREDQEIYEDHSAMWAEANMTMYGRTI